MLAALDGADLLGSDELEPFDSDELAATDVEIKSLKRERGDP
jgi:hypothetical protein